MSTRTGILERRPIEVSESDLSIVFQKEVLGPLFEESAELLDYHTPEERAKRIQEEELNTLLALQSLSIEPFTEASVGEYKFRMAFRANLARRATAGLLVLLAICAYVGSFVYNEVVVGTVFFIVFLVGWGVVIAVSEKWEWHKDPVSTYGGAIPEAVLAGAVQIKKACKKASLGIEYFSSQTRTVDQFLVVTAGTKAHYIERWDEPQFKTDNQ